MILKMRNMIKRFNHDYEIRGMDEVTYTTRQRKLYKTNKYHLIMAIIGAEDEKIDHLKKNILILISGRSIAFWRQTGAGSGP